MQESRAMDESAFRSARETLVTEIVQVLPTRASVHGSCFCSVQHSRCSACAWCTTGPGRGGLQHALAQQEPGVAGGRGARNRARVRCLAEFPRQGFLPVSLVWLTARTTFPRPLGIPTALSACRGERRPYTDRSGTFRHCAHRTCFLSHRCGPLCILETRCPAFTTPVWAAG